MLRAHDGVAPRGSHHGRKIPAALESPVDSLLIDLSESLSTHFLEPYGWTPNMVTHLSLVSGMLGIYYYRNACLWKELMKKRKNAEIEMEKVGEWRREAGVEMGLLENRQVTFWDANDDDVSPTRRFVGPVVRTMCLPKDSEADSPLQASLSSATASASLLSGGEKFLCAKSFEPSPVTHFAHVVLGAGFFFLQYFLDCADGYHARKMGMETVFGDVYDHAKDQACLIAMVVLIVNHNRYLLTSLWPRMVFLAMIGSLCFGTTMQLSCQEALHRHYLPAKELHDEEDVSVFLSGLMRITFAFMPEEPTVEEATDCLRTYRHVGCGAIVAVTCLLVLIMEAAEIRRIYFRR